MKGGILLALGYESTRFTRDIDFSTEIMLQNFDVEAFIAKFDAALVDTIDQLEYDIDPGFPRWLLPIADIGSTMGIRPRIRP